MLQANAPGQPSGARRGFLEGVMIKKPLAIFMLLCLAGGLLYPTVRASAISDGYRYGWDSNTLGALYDHMTFSGGVDNVTNYYNTGALMTVTMYFKEPVKIGIVRAKLWAATASGGAPYTFVAGGTTGSGTVAQGTNTTHEYDFGYGVTTDHVIVTLDGYSNGYDYAIDDFTVYFQTTDPTITPTSPSVPGNGESILGDGNHEQQPISQFWEVDTQSDATRLEFGRLNTSNLLTLMTYGGAACGNGMTLIGNTPARFFEGEHHYSDIRQTAHIPAGTIYYRIDAKVYASQTGSVGFNFYLKNTDGGGITPILSTEMVTKDGAWHQYNGSITGVTEGNYMVIVNLASYDGKDFYDALAIDNTFLSTTEISGAACPNQLGGGGTGTPSPSPTWATGDGQIFNCGFGQAYDYWWIRPTAEVVYGSDNQAWIAGSGALFQYFSWVGGDIYIQFSAFKNDTVDGFKVEIYNQDTGTTIPVTQGSNNLSGWLTYRVMVPNLPVGNYALFLKFYSTLVNTYSGYDNVTVSANNYAACNQGLNESPTATPTITNTPGGPTPTRTLTATPLQITSTYQVVPQTPTPYTSPYPTFTPFPTWTPWSPTATLQPTYTPYPTYTPFGPVPSATPWSPTQAPTQTPGGPTATPIPPGGDMPPRFTPGASCENVRPGNAYSVAGWINYQTCQLMHFVSVQPGQLQTLQALPNRYSTYEPFQSVNKMGTMVADVATEVATYEWSGDIPDQPIDVEQFKAATAGPYTGGGLNLDLNTPLENPYPTYCALKINDYIGDELATGICWILSIIEDRKMMWAFQLTFNVAAVAIFVNSILSILKVWVTRQ